MFKTTNQFVSMSIIKILILMENFTLTRYIYKCKDILKLDMKKEISIHTFVYPIYFYNFIIYKKTIYLIFKILYE